MTDVQLPRLLDDNLLEITRLHPESLSIDLVLSAVSTASMSVSMDEAEITVGQFVELFTVQGSAGIFVVQSVAYDTAARRQDVQLDHGIATLANNLMEGEQDYSGTTQELLLDLLGCQTRKLWALGTVESEDTLRWSCDYSNVLESIVTLMEQLPTYRLTFDQTILPWRLHVVRLEETDACECRLTRNMESLTVDVDRSELCTRLYIRGVGGMRKPEVDDPTDGGGLPPLEDFILPPQEELVERFSTTLEADTMATWGIVERVLDADQGIPHDELVRQGEIYLEERKNPAITITVDAYDLHQATGEPFDRFHLGRICRVCLPEYGTVIRHRVVGLTFTDALGAPERVTVTLKTQRATGIDTIAGIMVNTALHNEQISRLMVSQIVSDGWLEVTAEYLSLAARHIVVATERLDVLAEEVNVFADDVTVNAENIRLLGDYTTSLGERVSTAEISINGLESEITLKADKIDLQGFVTVDDLEAETIRVVNSSYFDYVRAELISAASIAATDVVATTIGAYDGTINELSSTTIDATTVNAEKLTLEGSAVHNVHSEFVTSIDDISVKYETVYFLDANQILQEITVVTDVQVPQYSTGKINYLSSLD